MEELVISVSRKPRRSDVFLLRLMAVLGILFLLQGILFSTAFMLPCFLTALCYYWYRHASKREYEYTLDEESLKIERVSDHGRNLLYEIPYGSIVLVCRPDSDEAAPYRKGGAVRVKKEDYTSYREDVPYYTVIVRDEPRMLKLLNSVLAFIIPGLATPFMIMMFRQNSRNFPMDTMEAARIDGLSEIGIFFRMYIPMMKATYAASAVIIFMNSWNAYMWPRTVMKGNAVQTMPMLIANMSNGYAVDYGMLMLGVLFCSLPTIIVFFVLQKQFAEGITGSVK